MLSATECSNVIYWRILYYMEISTIKIFFEFCNLQIVCILLISILIKRVWLSIWSVRKYSFCVFKQLFVSTINVRFSVRVFYTLSVNDLLKIFAKIQIEFSLANRTRQYGDFVEFAIGFHVRPFLKTKRPVGYDRRCDRESFTCMKPHQNYFCTNG